MEITNVNMTERRHTTIKSEKPDFFIAELNPGRHGGSFDLPFGGKMLIPDGVLGKKDVVTCCIMSPTDRHRYLPPLNTGEKLLSEIFLLATSAKTISKNLHLQLPFFQENTAMFDLQLLWKNVKEGVWGPMEFHRSHMGNFVELSVNRGGIFAVISRIKKEKFDIPVQGVLHNSKLSHQVSVRFPKKATNEEMTCEIMITPMNRENFPVLLEDLPSIFGDMLAVSDYVTIQTNIEKVFKRPVTVKLPLPHLHLEDEEHFEENDMVVLEMINGEWQIVESHLKFTKSAVMFDTKTLSKYCVALAKPDRALRMAPIFKMIQEYGDGHKGRIMVFVHVQEKLWTLCVECIRTENIDECLSKREAQGFRKVEVIEIIDEESVQFGARRPSRRGRKSTIIQTPKSEDVLLTEGMVVEVDLKGDVILSPEDISNSYKRIHYFTKLEENFRRFFIRPEETAKEMENDFTNIASELKVYRVNSNNETGECLKSFRVEFSEEEVRDFLFEKPLVKPEPERVPESEPQPETKKKKVPTATLR